MLSDSSTNWSRNCKETTRSKIEACQQFIAHLDKTYKRIYGLTMEEETEASQGTAQSLESKPGTYRKAKENLRLKPEILKAARQHEPLQFVFSSYAALERCSEKHSMSLNQWQNFCRDFDVGEFLLSPATQGKCGAILKSIFMRVSLDQESLSFEQFIGCLFYLSRISGMEKHNMLSFDKLLHTLMRPERLERFRQIIHTRKIKPTIDAVRYESASERKTSKYSTTTTLKFDIFRGPYPMATIESRPGVIQNVNNKIIEKSRFVNLVPTSRGDLEQMIHIVYKSENFAQLLRLLTQEGFDLVTAQEQRARSPIGRCWRFLCQNDTVGCVMDYPGQMGCFNWQPALPDLFNDKFCVTVYVNEDNPVFAKILDMFLKARSIDMLRDMLYSAGFFLMPLLPKLH